MIGEGRVFAGGEVGEGGLEEGYGRDDDRRKGEGLKVAKGGLRMGKEFAEGGR